ncbi:MAG: GreA/GreB family elongation factor [Bacteroidales bacterium]|nr:GreA/GreB family elongation factor [Bacteroidales bacterium]
MEYLSKQRYDEIAAELNHLLQKVLEHSRVIDPDVLPKDRVCLLSWVEFTNLSTNTRMKFKIVSPHEMNLEAGKISLKSPIGAALMGRKVGETVEARTPSGTLLLRIENISFD